MTIPYLTASKIAETIAHIDGLSDDDAKVTRTRFKNLDAKGYFANVADPNGNATSAKLYEKRELARAAVLIDAVAVGVEADMLVSIADALKKSPRLDFGHAPSADTGGAYEYKSGLDAAVRGRLANDPGRWLLTFSAGREEGRIIHTAVVVYVPEGERVESELALLRSPIVVGTIDLTARFKSFGWLLTGAAD